jgi:pimeloyl-ACP methyl ester carboxylesterase
MKTITRFLLLVVVLGGAAAAAFYYRPIEVQLQVTHFKLFLNHVHSEYVATPEGRIHYYEGEPTVAGGGTPIVLVHGLGDRAEAWAPMMIELKKAGFHVYALDLLGYGRSPKPGDSDYSISTQEQLVTDFIQALGLQKPDVAGWSMGGWVSLKLALDHPELVDRLVVYDAVGIRYQRDYPDDVFHITNDYELDRLVHLLEPNAKPLPEFVAKDALRKFAAQQWVIDRGIASMLTEKDALDDRMYQMSVPLLIVWGADDQLLPLSTVGEKFHALDPQSELDVLEGCGHLAPAVCTDRAASAAIDFLRANPVPQGTWKTFEAPSRQ